MEFSSILEIFIITQLENINNNGMAQRWPSVQNVYKFWYVKNALFFLWAFLVYQIYRQFVKAASDKTNGSFILQICSV